MQRSYQFHVDSTRQTSLQTVNSGECNSVSWITCGFFFAVESRVLFVYRITHIMVSLIVFKLFYDIISKFTTFTVVEWFHFLSENNENNECKPKYFPCGPRTSTNRKFAVFRHTGLNDNKFWNIPSCSLSYWHVNLKFPKIRWIAKTIIATIKF